MSISLNSELKISIAYGSIEATETYVIQQDTPFEEYLKEFLDKYPEVREYEDYLVFELSDCYLTFEYAQEDLIDLFDIFNNRSQKEIDIAVHYFLEYDQVIDFDNVEIYDGEKDVLLNLIDRAAPEDLVHVFGPMIEELAEYIGLSIMNIDDEVFILE